jgi:hypothetical protein
LNCPVIQSLFYLLAHIASTNLGPRTTLSRPDKPVRDRENQLQKIVDFFEKVLCNAGWHIMMDCLLPPLTTIPAAEAGMWKYPLCNK